MVYISTYICPLNILRKIWEHIYQMDYRVSSLERAMNWGRGDGGGGMGLVVKEDIVCLALLCIIGIIIQQECTYCAINCYLFSTNKEK